MGELWNADGQWAAFLPLQEPCALAAMVPEKNEEPGLWAAGRLVVLTQDSRGAVRASALRDLRLDNRWTPLG